jgi:hypothetical protein
MSVAAWWARAQILRATIDQLAAENREAGDVDALETEYDAVAAAERLALTGPIQTKADAAATVQAVHRTVRIGVTRNDGADVEALAAVAAWLEAQP